MTRVRMLTPTHHTEDGLTALDAGQAVEVDAETAARWIRRTIAEPAAEDGTDDPPPREDP